MLELPEPYLRFRLLRSTIHIRVFTIALMLILRNAAKPGCQYIGTGSRHMPNCQQTIARPYEQDRFSFAPSGSLTSFQQRLSQPFANK
jgi:hypothetical protein